MKKLYFLKMLQWALSQDLNLFSLLNSNTRREAKTEVFKLTINVRLWIKKIKEILFRLLIQDVKKHYSVPSLYQTSV